MLSRNHNPCLIRSFKKTKSTFRHHTCPIAMIHIPNLARPVSPLVANTDLIKSYFDHGLLCDARRVFARMTEPDAVTWTAMISGYASNSRPNEAWTFFCAMDASGVAINAFTISSVLTACKAMEFVAGTAVVHAIAFRRGVEDQPHVEHGLLAAYARCAGGMNDALKVFGGISQKNAVSWTTIVSAYVHRGDGSAAAQMCHRMFQEGAELNPFTLSIAFRASAAVESLIVGRQIHATTIKIAIDRNLPVSNSIIYMYSRCMSFSDARHYFNEMPQKNLITWNTMIAGLDHAGSIDACHLLLDMLSQSIQPNSFTFSSVISSCATLATLSFGQQVHGAVLQRGFGENQQIANALVNMYAKGGSIADSQKVFYEMCHRDLVSWTTMIIGHGVNGYGKEAIKLFSNMMSFGFQPDSVLFLGVISACSHSGLIEEGLKFFSMMESKYGVQPDKQVYGCMVDLLGRSGRLEKAYELIEKMPFEPDESIWGALLGACKMHKNVELGRIAAQKILNLKPKGAKTYVILSNIFAADSEWAGFSEMRKLIREEGSKKELGMSWIEVRGKVCSFVAGDRCNPCANFTFEVLELLACHIQEIENFGSVAP